MNVMAQNAEQRKRYCRITTWLAAVADYLVADNSSLAGEWLEACNRFTKLITPLQLEYMANQVAQMDAVNAPRSWSEKTNSFAHSAGYNAFTTKFNNCEASQKRILQSIDGKKRTENMGKGGGHGAPKKTKESGVDLCDQQ